MTFRIIPRLEIKNKNLIKGKKMEGLKKIGNPTDYIYDYFNDGADEIFICDIVASLYGRKFDFDFLKMLSKNVFLPIAVGGGINHLNDAVNAFKNGADKVVLNSYLFKDLSILNKIASIYGSQSLVAEIQYTKTLNGYELRYESGRNNPKIDIFNWMKLLEKNSVGEIYIMSIDNDGVINNQIDFDFLNQLRSAVDIPLIYGGGISEKFEIENLKKLGYQGAAISRILHFKTKKISDFK